jgi:uncharacterized protein (TIGR03083 family)
VTATCHRLPDKDYFEPLAAEVEKFAAAIADANPAAAVETCPGWDIAYLTEHIGGLYRWAEAHIRLQSPTRVSRREVDLNKPKDWTGAPGWLRESLEILAETASKADLDQEVWAWGSDKRGGFWPRRMLFETVVHRADAELARGQKPVVDPTIAVDGIDEFLDNLPLAAYFAPRVAELRGNGERLEWNASDQGVSWTIKLGPEGFSWAHQDESMQLPDAAIDAKASDLMLFVYGRRKLDHESLGSRGNREIVQVWVANSSL